jgi:hypothetical protein
MIAIAHHGAEPLIYGLRHHGIELRSRLALSGGERERICVVLPNVMLVINILVPIPQIAAIR